MRYEHLQIYLALCADFMVLPTWEGLKEYVERVKRQKSGGGFR